MSLSDQIHAQYNKRSYKAHLYQRSYYTNAVQKEIKVFAKDLLTLKFNNLSKVKLLEIGAGNGTNAFLFEEIGLKLVNISFNELIGERMENIKNGFPNNKLYEGDATHVQFPEKYDIVFQSTVFTSILNDKDRKALADKMWSLLNPGGVILWYDFIYNNPKNPDVKKVDIHEVKGLFNKSSNSIIKRITLAPPIGRKVGKLYHLFNVPFLRSHILAVFQNGNG
ncbi:MAG: class I SAM-dependent methyltransferase [Bacteroidota bacterium]|nr:class I SAM-dependent methyltransferase [Bacteroidota bacterium]